MPHRNTLSDDGYAFHKLSGNKANLILAKGNSIHSFEMRINGEIDAGEYIQRKEKLTEEEQRFEPLQNQSEQKEIEILYTGNEIWGRLLDEIRTCLLKAA
jgi:hypothetical protein